jgi:large subunit ribosomal protein L24e
VDLGLRARRNIPTRYNRDLLATTLRAISRNNEISSKREAQLYKNRFRGAKQRQRDEDRKLVAENQHLLLPEMREGVAVDVEMGMQEDDLDEEEELPVEREAYCGDWTGESLDRGFVIQ